MPSLNDFFTQLTQVNTRLQQIDNDLNAKLQQLDNDVKGTTQAVNQLVQLQTFAGQVLVHQSRQLDTVICILEHVSKNTCTLVNEAHKQTTLQEGINQSTGTLLQLYESVHPEAALVFERTEALRKQLLACCPPEPVPPVCTYEPCPAPRPLPDQHGPD